ncbi:hypothetical protein QZH41_019209, partial [Actinostola sp. cb2023]
AKGTTVLGRNSQTVQSHVAGDGEREYVAALKKKSNGEKACDQDLLIGVRVCNVDKCPEIEQGFLSNFQDPQSSCGFAPCEEFGCLDNPGSKCSADKHCDPVFFDQSGHVDIHCTVVLLRPSDSSVVYCGETGPHVIIRATRSNTATTAMMVPIGEAVLSELKEEQLKEERKNAEERQSLDALENVTNSAYEDNDNNIGVKIEMREIQDNDEEEVDAAQNNEVGFKYKKGERASSVDLLDEDIESEIDKQFKNMSKMLLLSIAYAANIGGTATLTGTAPNLILSGQVSKLVLTVVHIELSSKSWDRFCHVVHVCIVVLFYRLFPESPGIGFATWFMYAFPEMLILLFVAWVWLQMLFLGLRCCCKKGGEQNRDQANAAKKVLQQQYSALGPMSFAEKGVLVHFILLALLWLFRDPKFMPGWAIIFKKDYVRDGTVAMIIAFSLFICPSEKPKILCWNPEGAVTKPPVALLTWNITARKLPWNIIILLGSGFALAKACKVSGLSVWLGLQLVGLKAIPSWAIVTVVCVLITTFTEVTSNTATATIFLPILAALAESIQVNPWYLMIPATVSCSFAFMLPVATPPNAIVFASGKLKVSDMVRMPKLDSA